MWVRQVVAVKEPKRHYKVDVSVALILLPIQVWLIFLLHRPWSSLTNHMTVSRAPLYEAYGSDEGIIHQPFRMGHTTVLSILTHHIHDGDEGNEGDDDEREALGGRRLFEVWKPNRMVTTVTVAMISMIKCKCAFAFPNL